MEGDDTTKAGRALRFLDLANWKMLAATALDLRSFLLRKHQTSCRAHQADVKQPESAYSPYSSAFTTATNNNEFHVYTKQ
jgi:hypothetical protein